MSGEQQLRVVMSERLGAIGDIERRIVTETGAELVCAPLWTEAELIANGADADVLIVGASEPVNEQVLAKLPHAVCIVRRGVGVDNVDVTAATQLGIGVAFIPDASVEEVSDHALALLLSAERRIGPAQASARNGDVADAGTAVSASRRFGDLTLGIIGFGRIGRALARKGASVFGEIVAFDVFADPKGAGSVELLDLDTLLERSDLISLHASSAPDAKPILDSAAFALLRPGTTVVNTARGKLIDEAALIAALDSGQVGIAALDVTTQEPVSDENPLRAHPRVLLSAHTAAKGVRSSSSLREGVVDATVRALRGESPAYLSNPDVVSAHNSRLRPSARRTKS
jgi:D-3-phosphoglycerate dehydrogenase / 2-oxoglutarate reductase